MLNNYRTQSVFLLFLLVTLMHVAPLWIYGYFATQDGPSHLHNSAVMLDLLTARSPVFQEYYELQPGVVGNVISQAVLMGLLSVTSAALADKIFLSAYVVLLCMAFWYIVAIVRPGARWLAFMIFPFVYSSWLHLGFYNFSIGMALSLFVIGYFIRHESDFDLRRAATLTLMLLVLYLSHLVALAATIVSITALASVRFVVDREERQRSVLPLLATVPAVLLLLLVLSSHTVHAALDGLRLSAWRIYSVAPIAALSDIEFQFGKGVAAVAAVLGILAVYSRWKDRRLRPTDGLLLAAAGFLVLSLVGPDVVGWGGMIRMRMVFYFYFALVLWVCAQRVPVSATRGAALAAVSISVLLFAGRAPLYAELDRQIGEYLSVGAHIEPNTTLLSLSSANGGYHPTENGLVNVYLPFAQIAGLLASDKPVVDLTNYEPATAAFWTRFRPGLDPFHLINARAPNGTLSPVADLFGYPPESGGRIDYVVLWGFDERRRLNNPVAPFHRQLAEFYDLVYTSPGLHLAQLYRRKGYIGSTLDAGSKEE